MYQYNVTRLKRDHKHCIPKAKLWRRQSVTWTRLKSTCSFDLCALLPTFPWKKERAKVLVGRHTLFFNASAENIVYDFLVSQCGT